MLIGLSGLSDDQTVGFLMVLLVLLLSWKLVSRVGSFKRVLEVMLGFFICK